MKDIHICLLLIVEGPCENVREMWLWLPPLICAGNLVSVVVINSTELGLKLSFRRLISQLCVLDTVSVVLNILLFSAPFHSEHYRVQVHSRA